MEKKKTYKYCIVPCCANTTVRTPTKHFLRVPNDPRRRKKWCKIMKRNDKNPLSPKSTVHCCEDHFNIETDVENYMRFKLMGGMLRLRAGVVPHKFDCQKEKKAEVVRTAFEKRRRIEYYERLLDPNNIPTPAFPDVEFVQIENKDAEKCDETSKLNEDEGNGENEESEKEMPMVTCSTCLSSDRSIRPIPTDELRKTYYALLRKTDSRRVRLCWECEALLERVKNFKKRAQLARETLARSLRQSSVQTSTLSSLCTTIKLDFDLTYAHEPTPRKNKSSPLTTATVKDENDPLTDYNDAPSSDVDSYDDQRIELDIKFESDVKEESNTDGASNYDDLLVDVMKYESVFGVSEDSNLDGATKDDAGLVDVKCDPIAEDVMYNAETCSWWDGRKVEKVTLVVGEEEEMCVEVVREGEVTTELPVTQIYLSRPLMLEVRRQEKTDLHFVLSQHKCATCILTFDSDPTLKQHNKTFHVPRAKTKVCGVCGSYILPWRMRAHERAHRSLYKCRLCELYVRSYNDAIAHVREWHAEWRPHGDSYHCEICGQLFSSAKHRFEHHSAEHEERGQCDACGFTSLKSCLWLHIRLTHADETSPCNFCRKAFKNPTQLSIHVKSKHQAQKRKHLACEPCDLIFSSPRQYRAHLTHTKRHTVTGRFPCTNCRRSFPTSNSLQTHRRMKHYDKSICYICHKKLSCYSAVKKHVRNVHEGLRKGREPHVCEICGMVVSNKQQHKQTHSSVRRYACETCGATFRQNASLYTHKRNVHLKLKRPKKTKKKLASEESSNE